MLEHYSYTDTLSPLVFVDYACYCVFKTLFWLCHVACGIFSSLTRDRTHASAIEVQSPSHRESLGMLLSLCFADKEPKAEWFPYLLRSCGEWLKGEGLSQVFVGPRAPPGQRRGSRPSGFRHDPWILQLPAVEAKASHVTRGQLHPWGVAHESVN